MPDNFVLVEFKAGTNGTFAADTTTKYWVNPNKEVDLTDKAPTVTPTKTGVEHQGWDKALKAKFAEATDITATYKATIQEIKGADITNKDQTVREGDPIKDIVITPKDEDATITVDEKDLPEGVEYDKDNNKITGTPEVNDWEDNEKERKVEIPVVVENPDGSKTTEKVTITVTKKTETPSTDADKYEPEYKGGEGNPGEDVTVPAPEFKDKDGNSTDKPDGTTFTPGEDAPNGVTVDKDTGEITVTVPEDKNPEDKVTVPVVVEYPDGSKDEVDVEITVTEPTPETKDKDNYEPEYKGGEGNPGEDITVPAPEFKDKDGNSTEKPDGTTFTPGEDAPKGVTVDEDTGEIKVTVPEDKKPGDKITVPVVVEYPDGSTDEVEVEVTVTEPTPEEKDNEKYEPETEPVEKDKGEKPSEDEIKDAVTVPGYPEDKEDPKVTIDDPTQIPDGETPGNYEVDVTVEYPDGSKDKTKVTVTIKDEDQSSKPKVNQPTEGDDEITGEGEPGSKIVVKDEDDNVIGETTVDEDGKWEVPVPEDNPLKENDKITVEQTEDGKKPSTEETTVKGKEEPAPTPKPQPRPDSNIKPNPSPSIPPVEKPSKDRDVTRIAGENRVGTGIDVSKEYFNKAKTVIVVDSGNYPDALTASVLAKQLNAPILLNRTGYLEDSVKAEIERLGATEIIIVGGVNSISKKVEEALEPMDANEVQRIWGDDRFETSAEVAREVAKLAGGVNKAVIASGEVFADALASAPLAAKETALILLVRKSAVPETVNKAIADLNITSVYVAGGYNTVAKSVETDLPRLIERFDGQNRYETATLIAGYTYPEAQQAFVASGEVWPDALVMGPVAAKEEAPILLTGKAEAKETTEYVNKSKIEKLVIVGGENTISQAAVDVYKKIED